MSRRMLILIGFAAFMTLMSALSFSTFGAMAIVFLAITIVAIVFGLFFQVQSIDFFPACISINYILRKRRIDRTDIDFVSLEERRTNAGGSPRTVNYVQVKLRSGTKIDLSGFQEDIHTAYQKLKACESNNEDFLRGR